MVKNLDALGATRLAEDADSPDAAEMKALQILVADVLGDGGNAAMRIGGNRIQDGAVVDAVNARLHDHRARQSKRVVQAPEHRHRGVRRGIGPVALVGVSGLGTKNADMAIASKWGMETAGASGFGSGPGQSGASAIDFAIRI